MLDLSVLIVNWNTRQLLHDCLAAVEATAGTLSYEVIVVDNASTDGSRAMLRSRFPAVRLIENEDNVGFARANNQALAASCGRYLLLLNSDTVVQAGALQNLVRFVDRQAAVGIVGAQLLHADGTLQESWASFPTVWSELLGKNVRQRTPYKTDDAVEAYVTDWVGGACLLIRREAYEQVGPLDEAFFMYSEEVDWCYRARQAGWQVCYLPAAQVVHLGGQSSRQTSARMKGELYRSKLLFFAKHYDPRSARMLRAALRMSFALKAALGWVLCAVSRNRSRVGSEWYQQARVLASVVGQEVI